MNVLRVLIKSIIKRCMRRGNNISTMVAFECSLFIAQSKKEKQLCFTRMITFRSAKLLKPTNFTQR